MFDAIKVKDKCVLWIRDFFEKNGKGCNAVVGISGGKDSSVVAAMCVEALGRERVIGVLMPQGVQPDIEAAYLLVNHLGNAGHAHGLFPFCGFAAVKYKSMQKEP